MKVLIYKDGKVAMCTESMLGKNQVCMYILSHYAKVQKYEQGKKECSSTLWKKN